MCSSNIVLCYFVFLLIVSSSKSQRNSTDDDKRSNNSMVRHDSVNKKKSSEHVLKNNKKNQKMSMEFHVNSTEINGDFMLPEINENLTTTEDEKYSMSDEFYGNSNIDNSAERPCGYVNCIQLCCPRGEKLSLKGDCITGQDNYLFPQVYDNENKSLDKIFPLMVHDPCVSRKLGRAILKPNTYRFLANSSLLYYPLDDLFFPTSYCLAIITRNDYDIIVCVPNDNNNNNDPFPIYVSACLVVSLPFFLLTFIVYSILPELQNLHGYTLRAYVASLFIMYAILYAAQQIYELIHWEYCIPLAFIFNFSVLSSFFWLNIICFDIWWTFRGYLLNKISFKQDKTKFIVYSLYAWGIPFIHTVICVIMDLASGTSETWIRPKMCTTKFWMDSYRLMIYIYAPVGATVISNIYFFIATTLTISNQKKITAHQMSDSESKRHNENKQRLNMYLKLFILMGLTWIMELIADLCDDIVPKVYWYPTNMLNGLQGVIIFIIFVCTKKNKKLLLKRFEWNCGSFCKISTSDDSMANTTSISLEPGTVPMQEISSTNL